MVLDPIPDLTFLEASHSYQYKGNWLAATVSQVTSAELTPIQRASIERYRQGPDGWEARGNAVHKCLEQHLLGNPQVYDDKWAPWVETMLSDDFFSNVTTLASEYAVVLNAGSQHVGGTVDFILAYEDDPTFVILGDLKTVSSAKGVASRKKATEQLGGYALALEQAGIFVTQCVTAVSGPGKFKVKEQTPDECITAWREAWGRYEALQPDW